MSRKNIPSDRSDMILLAGVIIGFMISFTIIVVELTRQ